MKVYADTMPNKLEAVGNGSFRYRWNFQEIARPHEDPFEGEELQELQTQWRCDEVIVWNNPTPNSITQAVIAEMWDNDYEAKLVNEYNAAKLGLIGGSANSNEAKAKINAYKSFLEERATIKAQIDADCIELGIV